MNSMDCYNNKDGLFSFYIFFVNLTSWKIIGFKLLLLLRFGPTMLDTSERALDSGWNRSAAISSSSNLAGRLLK